MNNNELVYTIIAGLLLLAIKFIVCMLIVSLCFAIFNLTIPYWATTILLFVITELF